MGVNNLYVVFLGGYVPCNCDLRCAPITTVSTATEPTTGPPTPLQGRLTLLLSLYLEYGLVVRHSFCTRPIFPTPANTTANTVSALRPTRLRVYHSSALRGTSQSSAHHLMAALLQVYHSYQSASHLLPCATQPCLAPSALISLIIFQGWAGPLAASVAGSQSHDTAGSSIDHFSIYLCRRHRCRIQSTPRYPPTRAATYGCIACISPSNLCLPCKTRICL